MRRGGPRSRSPPAPGGRIVINSTYLTPLHPGFYSPAWGGIKPHGKPAELTAVKDAGVRPRRRENMAGITAPQAAYLGELFRLGGETDFVHPGSWAETLHVSAAAVSRMSRRLEKAGVIEPGAYRGGRAAPTG